MNCRAVINGKETSAFKITVGQKALIKCDNPIDFNNASLFYAGHKYPLVILNINKNSMEVTSYLVGKYPEGSLRLIGDGANIPIKGFSWETVSSIQGTKPFPAKGMVNLQLPILQIIGISIFLLATIVASMLFVKSKRRLKNDIDSIKKLKSIRSPIDELQYKIKHHERHFLLNQNHLVFIKNLQKELKLYLARELEIPFHIWTTKKCIIFLKKKNLSCFNKFSKKIILHLNELQTLLHKNLKSLSEEEAYNLSEKISAFSSKIHDFVMGRFK